MTYEREAQLYNRCPTIFRMLLLTLLDLWDLVRFGRTS